MSHSPVPFYKLAQRLSCTSLMGLTLGLCAGLGSHGLKESTARADLPYEQEPINYSKATPTDPIARLQKQLDDGQQTLAYDDEHGYLKSVLKHLRISPSSQVLVFSKTSFQRHHISPRTPRALYFQDDVYVGWVQQGDVLEFTAMDPQLGAVFYSLSQQPSQTPRFVRQTDNCLVCHSSSKTADVPGNLVRSVYPDRTGLPNFGAGTYNTNHDSPFQQRWGGWYVTGRHGKQRHLGNVYAPDREHPDRLDVEAGANLTDLSTRCDVRPYLTPHSDLIALMTLEHQSHMHNLITRSSYDARMALWYNASLNKAFGEPAEHRTESTTRRLKHAAESLLRYLLFVDEPPLTEPIAGTSEFAAEFSRLGPRDRQGRSLRDFDLQQRLFKYPCSYLIYSDGFRQLPGEVKEEFYRRLNEILAGRDGKPEFAKISPANRQAIREILCDTLPDLPEYFRGAAHRGE
ncbi:MAG: hypothetical protein ACKOUR_19590 [Planctomycetota bacterium]